MIDEKGKPIGKIKKSVTISEIIASPALIEKLLARPDAIQIIAKFPELARHVLGEHYKVIESTAKRLCERKGVPLKDALETVLSNSSAIIQRIALAKKRVKPIRAKPAPKPVPKKKPIHRP